jgi:hypothetical protein
VQILLVESLGEGAEKEGYLCLSRPPFDRREPCKLAA